MISYMKQGVTIVIQNKNKEFLLQLRDKKLNIPYSHHWVFPGAGVEEGEEPIWAVVREAKEEFELELVPGDLQFLEKYVHDEEEDFIFFSKRDELFFDMLRVHEGERIQFFPL